VIIYEHDFVLLSEEKLLLKLLYLPRHYAVWWMVDIALFQRRLLARAGF
jgi:hypothetical protein